LAKSFVLWLIRHEQQMGLERGLAEDSLPETRIKALRIQYHFGREAG